MLRIPYLITAYTVTLYTPEFITRTFGESGTLEMAYEKLQALFELAEAGGDRHARMGTLVGGRAQRVLTLSTRLSELEARIGELEAEHAQLDFYGVDEGNELAEVLDGCSSIWVQIRDLLLF